MDPRQTSVFGAAWTLAMAKAIAEGEAESTTFFETTGWRGVMETGIGPTLPGKFPSVAGAVFPVFHVLADIGEYSEGVVVPSMTDSVSQVASLMLRRGTHSRLLLANLAFDNRRVSLPDTTGRPRIRRMDDASRTSLQEAMHAPEHFRKAFATQDEGILDLPPYSVTTLDFSNT